MPHRVYIDLDRALGVVQWDGLVNGTDIVWAIQELYGNIDWKPTYQSCWDGRGLTKLELELEDMRQIADVGKMALAMAGEAKVASIITNELHLATMKVLTGLIRYSSLMVKFTKSGEMAADWLGVPIDWLDAPKNAVAVSGTRRSSSSN